MVSKEIRNCGIALGALLPQVDPEQAEVIRIIKSNLIAAADQAREMEANMPIIGCGCNTGPNTYVEA